MLDNQTTAIAKQVIDVVKMSGDINKGVAGIIAALATIAVGEGLSLKVLQAGIQYAYEQAQRADDEADESRPN